MAEGIIEYNVQTYVCDKCKKSGLWPKDIYLLRLDINKSADKQNSQLFIQKDYCESCYKIMSAKIKMLFEENKI